jgi:hypothetical protein
LKGGGKRRTASGLQPNAYGAHPYWTPEEDALIHRLYPDIVRIRKELPHRTPRAITARREKLGLVKWR